MIRRLVRSWTARLAVEGDSMRPALQPGDWLLVDPEAYGTHSPAVGDLVVAPDPRTPTRLLVKRVSEVYEGGQELWLRGEARGASSDSEVFGSVSATSVVGSPWFRYWPPRRIGRVS